MRRVKNIKAWWLIALIIFIGLALRLYHLSGLYYYTMDEEVMNLIQRRIVLGIHFPLIGSVSPLNTYLGPIFYYFGALILFFSKLNPFGQAIFAILLGAVNIFLIYKVTTSLFNKTIGIFASVFYSFSFLQVIFDRRFWHLAPGPFLSLLVLISIYKIKKGSIKYVYLLVAALIFGWNTDYTNLVLFLFTLIAWFLFKLPVRKKEIAIALVIFLVSNLPLVAFDFRHQFLNTRAFIGYFTHKSVKLDESITPVTGQRETLGQTRNQQVLLAGLLPITTFSRAIYTKSDLNISEQHTYCKDYIFSRNSAQGMILPILSLLIIFFFVYLTIRNRKSKDEFSYKLVVSFYLIFQLGVLTYAFLFKGDVFEHYLVTLMPYFFIILAVSVYHIYKSGFKYLTYLFLVIFILGNFYLILNAYNPFGYENKMAAIKYSLEKVGNQNFSLDSLGSCFRYDGYYYPFILNNRYPVKSYQDPNYSWLFDYSVADKHPSKVVVMVSKGKFEDRNFYETYNRYQQWVIDRKTFGGLEVLILDNSKGDFH